MYSKRTLLCAQCNKSYVCRRPTQQFCSVTCRARSTSLDPTTGSTVPRQCQQCGTEYAARVYALRDGWGLYCSKACSNSARALDPVARFWALVDQRGPAECWPWTGVCGTAGYGQFTIHSGSSPIAASRFALALKLGRPVDPGMNACHSCDNPPCCNPSHIREDTTKENMADRTIRGHSPRGKLTADDVRVIRSEYARGLAQSALAIRFSVAPCTISQIVNRVTWAALD